MILKLSENGMAIAIKPIKPISICPRVRISILIKFNLF